MKSNEKAPKLTTVRTKKQKTSPVYGHSTKNKKRQTSRFPKMKTHESQQHTTWISIPEVYVVLHKRQDA
jgi:hypothetical protein